MNSSSEFSLAGPAVAAVEAEERGIGVNPGHNSDELLLGKLPFAWVLADLCHQLAQM
jgi:hypothetical protein